MRQIALRGIPDDLHRELKAAAARNHRSLNGEILARLTASVRPGTADVTALLARIRQRRETLGPIDLSEATLRELRNAGRL
ncbi:MAG: Arc family DNA-binding protein [Chloroflexi bacterium]|nr:Arc family DNA-binding protein [Chloroflexota bacterium]MCY4112979.1 Arc family DNA-binding protein [Chloroflexota bacterium]